MPLWPILLAMDPDFGAEPMVVDSDGGGVPDGVEVFVYFTDPRVPEDDSGFADLDADGLTDWEETRLYGTALDSVDTDHDLLADGHEVKVSHTDPLLADSDGDDLADGDEVFTYETDPLDADTDGGGVPDGAEIAIGTSPRDAMDDFVCGRSATSDAFLGGGGARAMPQGNGSTGSFWSWVLSVVFKLAKRGDVA